MSDFMTNLKYRLEPITEKLGMGDKPIGRVLIYAGVIVLGFGVLVWAIFPRSEPLVSQPRNPVATTADDGSDTPSGPPKQIGSSRQAPEMPGG